MKKSRNHYHKYERVLWPNGSPFYKCMIPGCAHYLSSPVLVIGRESLCWGCEQRLVEITRDMVNRNIRHPMCEKCKEERKEQKLALQSVPVEEILKEEI